MVHAIALRRAARWHTGRSGSDDVQRRSVAAHAGLDVRRSTREIKQHLAFCCASGNVHQHVLMMPRCHTPLLRPVVRGARGDVCSTPASASTPRARSRLASCKLALTHCCSCVALRCEPRRLKLRTSAAAAMRSHHRHSPRQQANATQRAREVLQRRAGVTSDCGHST